MAIIPERQAAHEWGTWSGGSYYAVGIGGGLTGRGYDIGVIDDPVKDEEEATSLTYRERAWDWYQKVFRTRAEPDAAIIVVMTRWHEDDLVGRLLEQMRKDPTSDQWEVLHLLAIKDGQALWPARYPLEVLEKTRASMGSRAFESLYQGNPTVAEGQIIKREWWKYFREKPTFTRMIHSWDTAFKDKSQNDYSVCTVWGEALNGYYLLDVWRAKVEFPELKRAAIALDARDSPSAVAVEDKASGQSLIQELRRDTKIPVLPVKVDINKVARANAITPLIEAGKVFLPENAPWLFDYIEELSAFPNATHDDQVDSTTQALSFMRGPQGKPFMVG
uniref:Putative terminase n=1 Tax=viral metagenome TaxID=1070528 RepID=A0A6M3KVF4_9ZZZZ